MKEKTKETIFDICVMFYQFVFAFAGFFILSMGSKAPLVGKAISPLSGIAESINCPLWFLGFTLIIIFGVIGMYIQRKIYLKIKKENTFERRSKKR